MTAKSKKRILNICMGFACLLLGSALYILFRPTTLLMFHWADALGLTNSIGTMRAWASGLGRFLPTWIVFSLPFALWVSAYLFFTEAIWINSTALPRHIWFWCIPLIAILAELAQSIHFLPGNFDIGDLAAIIVSIIIGLFTTSTYTPKKGVKET